MNEPPSGPWWIWLFVLASFAYQFWMIRDMLSRDTAEIRGGRVGPWLLAIIFGGPMGALMYQLGGRKDAEAESISES